MVVYKYAISLEFTILIVDFLLLGVTTTVPWVEQMGNGT